MSEELKNNETFAEGAAEPVATAVEEPAAETANGPAETSAEETTTETMDNFADQIDEDPVWKNLEEIMQNQTILTVEVGGVVKAGVVAYVDGIRGFIPASQLALGYVEDLESWLHKQIDVMIITADAAEKRLVLSGKKVAKLRAQEEKKAKIAAVKIGTVVSGEVESIKPYGAFVNIGDGLTGLVHVSQISQRRIKSPEDVLKVGDQVNAKIIAVKDGKISLSIKALAESSQDVAEEVFPYKEEGKASTSLGALLKGIKLD